MSQSLQLDRRAFLKGAAGATLALPVLEAMGKEVAEAKPRRFCALYTANGMSLPHAKHGIDEWSWFPRAEKDGQFVFGKSTEAFTPFRKHLSFMGGLYHPNGPKSDPHVCSDMWLTGAPLQDPKRKVYNSVALDQMVAKAGSLKNFVVEVQGFTDKSGSKAYNLELSKKRADAVVRYLTLKHNIPLHRIYMAGFGMESQIADGANRREVSKNNRRVELKLYVNGDQATTSQISANSTSNN